MWYDSQRINYPSEINSRKNDHFEVHVLTVPYIIISEQGRKHILYTAVYNFSSEKKCDQTFVSCFKHFFKQMCCFSVLYTI